MGTVALIVLGIVVLGAAAWYSYHRKEQRRLALFAFAGQHQLEYSRTDPFGLVGYDFHLLGMGEERGCENVLSGLWEGLPVREADYWYYTQSTDSKGSTTRTYSYFSIVIADLDLAVPYVTVSKEGLFSRLTHVLGFQDIQFEWEEFNREFLVKSEDPEFAFKLVDARMMRWLLSTGETFGFEIHGPNLLVYCHRVRPTELIPLFGTLKAFRDHIPRLVWNEYGSEPAAPAPEPTERSQS